MNRPLPSVVVAALALLIAGCHTTQPLPELPDAGQDAGVPLHIETSELSSGIPQVPYLERLQASGGVRPLRWVLEERPGTGFGWLNFLDDGELSGTPTRLETGSVKVSVHDATGAFDSVSLALSVVACDEGAQYPCEIGDAGACELGIQTCSGGQVGGCGSLIASGSVLGCGANCIACDPTRADRCIDGGTCSCGPAGSECGAGSSCCPGGACADLSNDPTHCKACDNDCTARAPANTDAGCGVPGRWSDPTGCAFNCAPNYQDCKNGSADGCESNLKQDTSNCGGCGNDCLGHPHQATGSCNGGQCAVVCDPNYANCNGSLQDGCESDLRSLQTCGTCGNPCSTFGSATTCTAGTCVLHCDSTHANCDSDVTTGCETPQSVHQCGCGSVDCDAVAGAYATDAGCFSLACKVTQCSFGHADCNGTFSDGCEVDTTNDDNNCGACGRACDTANQESCLNSKCCVQDCSQIPCRNICF